MYQYEHIGGTLAHIGGYHLKYIQVLSNHNWMFPCEINELFLPAWWLVWPI